VDLLFHARAPFEGAANRKPQIPTLEQGEAIANLSTWIFRSKDIELPLNISNFYLKTLVSMNSPLPVGDVRPYSLSPESTFSPSANALLLERYLPSAAHVKPSSNFTKLKILLKQSTDI
jgi:hypothetical protein